MGQRIKMKWVDDPHSEYQKWVDEQSDLCLYLHMLSVSVSVSTLCRKCVEVGVTPHTQHIKLDQFFFESYPFSHGVSVCPPVYWQQTTFKLPYTLRYLKVGNSNYIKL